MTLLDMENKEGILLALKGIDKDVNAPMPAILEEYIREIAKHGLTYIPWVHIKPLIMRKFNRVIDSFLNDSAFDEFAQSHFKSEKDLLDLRRRVFQSLSNFQGTPFTIQRICELLVNPRKNYNRQDKFLKGFEKTCLVISTVDCYGNKIHHTDPRFSGNISIEESSAINGSCSVDQGSTESADELSSSIKRSDDEEYEEEESELSRRVCLPTLSANLESDTSSWSTISPSKPCINFHRPLTTSLSPQSNTSENHASFQTRVSESTCENERVKSDVQLLYQASHPYSSDGIPGKQTLHRSFFSTLSGLSRPSLFESSNLSYLPITFHPLRESAHNQLENCGIDVDNKNIISIQKLISESENSNFDISKSPIVPTISVPSIDQMLRPMGQLEAFVNTISIGTSSAVESVLPSSNLLSTNSILPHNETVSSDPLLSTNAVPLVDDVNATSITHMLEQDATQLSIRMDNSTCCLQTNVTPEELDKQPAAENVEHDTETINLPSHISSTCNLRKRKSSPIHDSELDSSDIVVDSNESPAKRIRIQDSNSPSFPEPPLNLPFNFEKLTNESSVSIIDPSDKKADLEPPIVVNTSTLDQESEEEVINQLEDRESTEDTPCTLEVNNSVVTDTVEDGVGVSEIALSSETVSEEEPVSVIANIDFETGEHET